MKRNTHQDAEARKVYDLFWESYLSGDENTFISLLDDEFKMIGTSEAEVCHNKAEAITFFRTTTNEISGKAELRNREISLVPLNGLILINEMANVYALIDTEWRFYSKIRLSTLLHDTETGWKVVHQHGSMPDTRVQEGETLAFEQIKTENLQLRDAVNRRTIELEHKNRELEIETSLERVRAVAMGMKHPADMLEVCHVISDQLQLLGVPDIRNVQTAIINAGKGAYMNYQYFATYQQGTVEVVEYNKHPKVLEMVQKMQQSPDAFFSTAFEGEELQVWRQYRKDDNQFPDPKLDDAKGVFFYFYSIGQGGLGISAYTQLNEEDIAIFHRFRNVFALAYSRFMDIEQAEAQAKEARIELALERVRARAMSMQNSDELAELVSTVFKELTQLDFSLTSCIIWINHPELGSEALWVASSEINKPAQPYYIKPFYHSFFKSISQAWKAKDPKWIYVLTGEEKDAFEEAFFNDIPDLPDALKAALAVPDKVVFSASFNNFGALEVLGTEPLNDEKFDVLHRFGRVFDLCYTRFNDLQKAEAQAREAQIEAALEKVRAKVMAMNTSQDLNSTSLVFGEQLRRLGIDWQFSYFWLIEEDKDDNTFWITWPDHQTSTTIYSLAEADESFKECIIAWRNQERIHGTQVPVEHVQAWLDTFERITRDAGGVAVEIMKAGNFKDGVYYYDAMIRFGSFGILMNRATTDEEKHIQSRFATEFERAYTRFLDLQKAETQAREAHIEAALERVRSRTMAMARSDELSETAQLLFKQFKDLGETPIQIAIGTMHDEERLIEFRITDWAGSGSKVNQALQGSIDEPTLLHKLYVAWKEQKKSTVVDLTGKELVEWTKYRNSLLGIPVKKDPGETRRVISAAFFSKGMITMHTRESRPAESLQLLERFAGVFDLTYTRFLDLKKAEAQAREARIEVALERVRAQTMAMHKSEELAEASKVLFHELHSLGIETIRSGFGIFDAEKKTVKVWMTTLSNNLMEQKVIGIIPVTAHPAITANFNAWKQNQTFLSHEFVSEEVKQYYKALAPYVALPEQEILHEREWFNAFFFSEGAINVITEQRLSEEKCNIILRFARVFGLIYRRFLDLQKAEAQAREAKIEAALERLRAKAMAMHHSDELDEVLAVLCEQFDILGILPMSAHMTVLNIEHNKFTFRETGKFGNRSFGEQTVALDAMDTWKDMVESWKNAEPYSINSLHFPKETLPQVWEVFHESFASMPEGSRIIPDDYPDGIYHTAGKHPYGYIGMNQIRKATDEEEQIVIKFANEFGRAYTRFLDLQKAEAQARESKIEAALERIRAKAMAMHHSEDVNQAVAVVFEELDKLNLDMLRCGIGIIDKEKRSADTWITSKSDLKGTVQISGNESMDIHPLLQKSFDVWLRQEDLMYVLEGEDLLSYYRISGLGNVRLPDSQLILTESASKKQYYHLATFQAGGLFAFREMPFPEDAIKIMKRFAGVFHLTYKRFLDLQKAESQAREAKIEASLERVRSKAMAMHKSEDLNGAVATVFEELDKLSLGMLRCGIGILDKEQPRGDIWITVKSEHGDTVQVSGDETFEVHPLLLNAYQAWQRQEDYYYVLQGDDLASYYKALTATQFQSQMSETFLAEKQDQQQYYFNAVFQDGSLFAFRESPFSDEAKAVMKRFAGVFNLTYKRFLDLQKAEAQAREAQIQLALERVRARTMAMHHSDELTEVVKLLYQEFDKLKISNESTDIEIGLIDEETGIASIWAHLYLSDGTISTFNLPMTQFDEIGEEFKIWKATPVEQRNALFLTNEFSPEQLEKFAENASQIPELSEFINLLKEANISKWVTHNAYFSHGLLTLQGAEAYSSETQEIQKRFAKVFEQTYIRFLDLQKAEAQTREAVIEAALEKVRGKAMAMQTSNDLSATASTVFVELRKLGIHSIRSGVGLLTQESRKVILYAATSSEEGVSLSLVGWVMLQDHPVLSDIYDSWIRHEDYFPILKGELLQTYYAHILSSFSVPGSHYKQYVPDNALTDVNSDYAQHGYFLAFSEGFLYGWSEKPYMESEIKILNRFKLIIDLTFRRYLELQKSEANARDAVRQASLDRVRAQTASMRSTADLEKITPLMWNELTTLGVPFTRCGVFIMDDEAKIVHTYLSTAEGKDIAAIHLPYNGMSITEQVVAHWRNQSVYTEHWDKTAFHQWTKQLIDQGHISSTENYHAGTAPDDLHLHFVPFTQGMLYVGSTEPHPDESLNLIQSLADAFATAYARYEDFNRLEAAKIKTEQALADLESAKDQLVQQEKLASLGQLTAGIAHEIKNPLNFVNNFSEVSMELLDEMLEELEKGNSENVKSISDDIKANLDKIHEHGSRADSIVKSMLLHSRGGSGQKEPTDLNALIREYVNLTFHGMRAGKHAINVQIDLKLDETVGPVPVIVEDISRVIVNLCNNAFDAMRSKLADPSQSDYTPKLTVRTTRDAHHTLIEIADNGPGIPEDIKDKILQPFFTTKKGTQGTGLGLSITNDIVKAHGGELKVESVEGEGSVFVIQLPQAAEA